MLVHYRRFTDGSVGILEDFVQEAAMASMGITAETSADAMTIDRRHADSLHYEEFLARYMQPNRPVLIQASSLPGFAACTPQLSDPLQIL